MNRPLVFAAIAEFATGVALTIVPSLVSRLLLGEELAGISLVLARVCGFALVGLGVACWPGPPSLGMGIYSALATVYLFYLAVEGQRVGPLLWPAVVVHAVLTAWLAVDHLRRRALK